MLRSFRVENHKSIRDEQELSFLPVYDKSKPVVPVAAIFGANASGKSNLLDALSFMQQAVRRSHWLWEPGRGVPRSPFRLSASARDEPSHYTVELVVDGVRHTYGFVVDDWGVMEEWLYTYPHGRKRIVFEREPDGRWVFGTTMPRGEVEILRKLTRANALFLGVAAHSELAAALPVYRWFQGSLTFHDPGLGLSRKDVIAWLDRSPAERSKLVELVRAADLGITDLRLSRASIPLSLVKLSDKARETYRRLHARSPAEADAFFDEYLAEPGVTSETSPLLVEDLVFAQGPDGTELSEQDQSKGTLAWLGLVLSALSALEDGSMLCVDEIDSSLHPHLVAQLVGMFRDREANMRGAQLLFTTHDATLLGTSAGEDILQRDEVWFVEKDRRSGASRLYPLTDFHPRKEDSTQRRYLGGGYGAVPLVDEPDVRRALGLDLWAEDGRATA